MALKGLAYRLNNILHVSLTNACVRRPFLELRGAGYRLPESSGFQPLAAADGVGTSDVVSAEDVDKVVDDANDPANGLAPFGTVFGGHFGDPLLEIDVLVRAAHTHARTHTLSTHHAHTLTHT